MTHFYETVADLSRACRDGFCACTGDLELPQRHMKAASLTLRIFSGTAAYLQKSGASSLPAQRIAPRILSTSGRALRARFAL